MSANFPHPDNASTLHWPVRGLFAKFLLVLIPVFLGLAVPGLALLLNFELRDDREALAARIGNQAARVAAAFGRHDTDADPRLAQDFLNALAADRAFLCAEVRNAVDGGPVHMAPAKIGCRGQSGGLELTLPVGSDTQRTLHVRFTDAEVVTAKKVQRSLTLSVIATGFLIAVIAASLGFRLIIARRLARLLAAIHRNSIDGQRAFVETSGNDELTTVIGAFNDMVRRDAEREQALEATNEALRETQQQYETLNEELEERVRTRTSELKQREMALRSSEKRFSDFAETSSDWYWEMDENLRFSYFSDRFLEVSGVEPAMLLGKTRQETGIPNVDPANWRRQLDDLANHRPFRNFIHPREKPNGETVWLSINGTPHFDEQGRFLGYRGTGREITDLVAARQYAEEARINAETANRAKSQFLANMSHELRTPLNAIIGFSETIESETFGPIERQPYREYAGFIRTSGCHLLEIINDILDVSKIESGTDELHETVFDIQGPAQGTFAMLQTRANEGGIDFRLDLAESLPQFHGDERKIKQILVNLLSNAIKFTPADGTVVLKIPPPDAEGFVIEVSDTGIGIAEEDIPKAVTPFQQIQDQLNRTYEGTGLGLPLSRALAEQHGGSLDIRSEVGHGTTVTVRFPAARIVVSSQDEPFRLTDDSAA